MARFYTSDMHFGHANIIRYCARPFADVDHMNHALVERWNDTVGADDEVWVLGDVALGTIADSLALVGRLNGRKTLLAGNHDRCWAGYGDKAQRWVDVYLDAGFDAVLQDWVPVALGDIDAVACHLPYAGDSHDLDRFTSHRPPDDGKVLLHGHVHDSWLVNGRQVNVGVDVWDYRPASTEQLVAALAAAA